MHALVLTLGIGCTAYFFAELLRLAVAAARPTGFCATDLRTGRRLPLRIDRRRLERRGWRGRHGFVGGRVAGQRF